MEVTYLVNVKCFVEKMTASTKRFGAKRNQNSSN